MIEPGLSPRLKQVTNLNKWFRENLKESLDDKVARITLAKFLRHNLGLTYHLLTGGEELYPFQEIMLAAWFNSNFSLNIVSRGGAKCIDENSFVFTDRGLIKIKDIQVGDKIQSNNKDNCVLAKHENSLENGFEIISHNNLSFKGKIGHKVLIYNSLTLQEEYKNIEELNIGDVLINKVGFNFWPEKSFDLLDGFSTSHRWKKFKKINIRDEDDLYYLLGILIGDGHISGKKGNIVSVTTADKETKSFFIKKVFDYFPNHKVQVTSKGEKAKEEDIRISSKNFIEFLQYIGFNTECKAHEKIIPPKILKATKKRICLLLRGLFDTDGYCSIKRNDKKNFNHCRVGFCSTSLELAKTVQFLLMNLGIENSTRISHKAGLYKFSNGKEYQTKNAYSIAISGFDNLKLFNKLIGFGIKRKSDNLSFYLKNKVHHKGFDNNQISMIGDYLEKKYGKSAFKRENGRKYKIHKNLSFNRLKWILNLGILDSEDTIKINNLINNNYRYAPIKKINPVLTKTIDIQVENEECYWSDGFIHHNSFLFGVFCMMYPLFYANTKIVIVSANFRSSRRIFEHVERVVHTPNATMLRNCFSEKPSHKNDAFNWEINGGILTAVPLSNGDGLRGLRANVLGIDELLLLSESVVEEILKPFLVAKQNQQELMKIRAQEDILIKEGLMTEDERESDKSTAKFIGLSSASYKFEYLYRLYQQYIKTIMSEEKKNARHCIFQLGWKALPPTLIDKTIAEEFKGGMIVESAGNKREFGAQFTDDSEGYFSAKKMELCTIAEGQSPSVQIVGNKADKCILTIDPSYSSSKSSDFFAMEVGLLDEENQTTTLVHSYGVAGGDLKNHIKYLLFILTNFNIVYLVVDFSGTEFIDACNESVIFKQAKIELKTFDANFDCEGQDYTEEMKKARRNYRKIDYKMVYPQLFNSMNIRRMNENLQRQIDNKKVWFASRVKNQEEIIKKYMALDIPCDLIFKPDGSDNEKLEMSEGERQKMDKLDFIEQQDFWIEETKKQTALIELKATGQGTQTFDLPDHLKRSKQAKRARKDHYTCLMLMAWGARCYFDLMSTPLENYTHFAPTWIV